MDWKKSLTIVGTACGAVAMMGLVTAAHAKTVKVTLTAKEVKTVIDNKGTTQMSWTYDGDVPGPVVRATVGDDIEFTLINEKSNKESHSIDFHAARVNVLDEFAPIKPGETKQFTFPATKVGTFFYHCGAPNMAQHIARGMSGVIIIDPKKYSKTFPKPDREYVLVQQELYPDVTNVDDIMAGKWSNVVFNGTVLKYDPVHDPAATQTLVAKPGELVRVHFVNAGPHEFSAFHPIAGIWERAYPSGNPANVQYGMQTSVVGPGDGASFDLISPVPGGNAIVTHSLKAALTGAIAVIVFSDDADPAMGRGDNILVR